MDIACWRGFPIRIILQYDLTRYCFLFDKVWLARHKKHEILKPLGSDLKEEDYKLNWNDDLKTAVVVDFICLWSEKFQFLVHKNIKESLESTLVAMILSPGDINQIHVVYNSYLQNSIQESEQAIRVNLKSFWSSASNKHQLRVASRTFSQIFSGGNMCNF